MRTLHTRTTFAALASILLMASFVSAQSQQTAHVRPIVGSRMIFGDGEVAEYTLKCFLHLCREPSPNVVIISLNGDSRATDARLKEFGAASVATIDSINSDAEALTLQMLNVSGVWVEGSTDAISENRLMLALLKNVTKRNGVVAAGSDSVSLIKALDENDTATRVESPFAKLEFHFGKEFSANTKDTNTATKKVHCLIPDSSVLVIHGGRKIAGYGHDDVELVVEEANGWPERRDTFECPDVFSPGSYPFYARDLLSWIRSANERNSAVFPPEKVSTPVVEAGTLFLHGGSRIRENVMREFIKLVGGEDAQIVCIPSASRFEWSEEVRSHSAEMLAELGHSNFTILHTGDPLIADQNEEFAELLGKAKGVWIDGGRTYRFMDCYQGTQIESLLAGVLHRGGVVGGSSAGCQIPSDFLVRGNPRTNRDIVHDGYTRGLGLLKGVIIDAHFLQRGRHEPFLELMKSHPQMLGIGIDESTAIVVQGTSARVIGAHAVSIYDLNGEASGEFKPVILKAGETYNFERRATER